MSFLGVNSLSVKPAVGRSEYGRVKVALPRGKSLMDWVRLTAGKILAKKRLTSVDEVELMKHNTRQDCWIHIFGEVYDITEYLEFHPGGIPELMRAAGRDGTHLFNQYHAWVNYQNFLKSCHVGHFQGDLSKLPSCDEFAIDDKKNTSLPVVSNPTPYEMGIDVRCDKSSVIISNDDWNDIQTYNVSLYMNKEGRQMRLLVRPFKRTPVQLLWDGLSDDILSVNPTFTCHQSSIQIIFPVDESIVADFKSNSTCSARKRPPTKYHKCDISKIDKISRDTYLYHIKYSSQLFLEIPLAHHVSIKVKKGVSTLYRPYTPVGHISSNELMFMIKIYENGICTPSIKKLNIDDPIEISDPIGDTDFLPSISLSNDILMIAAGTGITPMIGIIRERSKQIQQGQSTILLLFNKTEEDIIKDDWMPIRWDDDRIQVRHILSEPSSCWNGLHGRINTSHLPPFSLSTKVFICGPDGFVQSATSALSEMGYLDDRIHIFQG